jgi:hypothetical protein
MIDVDIEFRGGPQSVIRRFVEPGLYFRPEIAEGVVLNGHYFVGSTV